MQARERSKEFLVRLVAAFLIVITPLAAGVILAVSRVDAVAAARIAAIRAEEAEISAVQRLRWSAELMVSVGRGFLLSGEPEVASKLRGTVGNFEENLARVRAGSLAPPSLALLDEVQRTAARFRDRQAALVAARARGSDGDELARRFEDELRPSGLQLASALDRLVLAEENRLEEIYAQVARDRRQLMASTWAVLGALVLGALGVASLLARALLRAYRTEEEARAQAQRAVSARDELMGVVAHDLRSPLGAITMKAGMLHRLTSPEAIRKQATSIESVAVRMDFIIKDLLDVASLEAGRFSLDPASCPVEPLLREIADMLGSVATGRSIVLDRQVSEPDLAVHGDHVRLLQVLSNLVGNAIKFTPAGGHIRLAAERQGEEVRFTVADTGPGISPAALPHVFERFWKQEKHGSKGTGLGLFISRRIVEAHGGRIWVESEPGHGAVFTFVIPRAATRPSTGTGIATPAPEGLGEHRV